MRKNDKITSESEIREYIREVLLKGDESKGSDILSPHKKAKEQTTKLRSNLVNLLKNIENGDFKDGVEKVDKTLQMLSAWKEEMSKVI